MTKANRFLNSKTIAIMATLLVIVACYFAARKVMALDVELGMNEQTVLEAMGNPTHQGSTAINSKTTTYLWESVCISEKVYQRSIVVWADKEHGVMRIEVYNKVFGWTYLNTRVR